MTRAEHPSVPVPAHGSAVVPWEQTVRAGSVDDRRLNEVTVRLPPTIASLDIPVSAPVQARIEATVREITALDDAHGEHLGALATLLLRNESVASSKIEHVEASVDDYARALHGVRSNTSATSMVASTQSLAHLISSVTGGAAITVVGLQKAHRVLMADDPYESQYAGRFRDMQNWTGGSDHSPRGALYVPPPAETVEGSMADLLEFANRTDLSALVQAAVVHAQFESIHPYTDGNGRIGRALINTVLRRRGVTSRVVVPLASALVARRDDYFAALGTYREGDAGPIVEGFAAASAIAAAESRVTADRIARLPETWHESAGRPRRGSATARLVDSLRDHPIFSVDDVIPMLGAPSTAYGAVTRLHEAGIVRPLTDRTRNQVWGAVALLDELADLSVRIAARATGAAL